MTFPDFALSVFLSTCLARSCHPTPQGVDCFLQDVSSVSCFFRGVCETDLSHNLVIICRELDHFNHPFALFLAFRWSPATLDFVLKLHEVVELVVGRDVLQRSLVLACLVSSVGHSHFGVGNLELQPCFYLGAAQLTNTVNRSIFGFGFPGFKFFSQPFKRGLVLHGFANCVLHLVFFAGKVNARHKQRNLCVGHDVVLLAPVREVYAEAIDVLGICSDLESDCVFSRFLGALFLVLDDVCFCINIGFVRRFFELYIVQVACSCGQAEEVVFVGMIFSRVVDNTVGNPARALHRRVCDSLGLFFQGLLLCCECCVFHFLDHCVCIGLSSLPRFLRGLPLLVQFFSQRCFGLFNFFVDQRFGVLTPRAFRMAGAVD